MKDYRLSEIVTHCKEMHDRYGEKACDNCDGARFCENQYANIPRYWTDEHDIEPRDMIELPCKIPLTAINGQVLSWQVAYRSVLGIGDIRTRLFDTEAEADAFLAELKGAKNEGGFNIN